MALGDHIKLYTTTASAISAEGNSTKMHVSAVENSELVLYDKHYNNYADQYLHIHSDASFKIKYTQSTETTGKLYYSYDKITWTELQNNVYLNIIASGTTQFEYWSVYLKGNLSPSLSKTGIGTIYIVNTSSITNSEINIDGNIMSLCYMDSFITNFGCDVSYYFYRLFASQQTTNCTYNLSNLILPNKLSEYCFCEMFFNVKINSFPKFPALHLKEGCYMSMFEHQTSSTGIRYNTIILPAKYVPKNAYYNMFLNNNTTISSNYYNIYLYFSNYENADSIAIFGIDVNNIVASSKGHSIYFKGYSNFKPNLYGTIKSITGYIDFDATAQNPVTVVDSTKKFNTLNIYNNHNDIIASNATVLPKLNNINVSINSLVSNGLKGNRDNLFITYKSSDNITRSICYDFTNEFDFELPFNVGTVDIYLYEYDENGNIINSRYENKKINKYYTHNFSTSDLQIEAPIIYFDKSSNYDEPGYTSKKYPQIIIDFRKDNLSGPSSILTHNTDEAFIYYNISNYSFIEEQKLDTNTNNKWNNYISIRVATKTSLQNSPIIISDETFKKLHIDPSKKIYVKAKSVYKINNNIYESKETVFSTKLRNIFEKDYFAVTANGAYVLDNIILHNTDNIPVLNNLQYSFDKYNWYDINSSDINEYLLVGSHDNNTNTYQTVYLKAYGINSINLNTKLMKFVSNDNQNINVTLSGNILSLIYGDNFTDIDEPFTDFSHAFASETNIVNAKNLILPSKNLVANCYQNMFSGCSNLLYPPELPATELADACYSNMFNGCTSLVETPLLPALNTNASSYFHMFWHTNKDLIFKPIYTKNFDTKDIYCYQLNENYISLNSTNNIILNKFRNNDINDVSSELNSNLNVEYSAIPFEDQYLTMTLKEDGYGIFKVPANINFKPTFRIWVDYYGGDVSDDQDIEANINDPQDFGSWPYIYETDLCFNGNIYYLWRLDEDNFNPLTTDTNKTLNIRGFLLTTTAVKDILYYQSLEYDINYITNKSPSLYAFLTDNDEISYFAVKDVKDFNDECARILKIEDLTETEINNLNIDYVKNIDYIAYSINNGESWDYTEIPINNEEIIITTPNVTAGTNILWKAKANKLSNYEYYKNGSGTGNSVWQTTSSSIWQNAVPYKFTYNNSEYETRSNWKIYFESNSSIANNSGTTLKPRLRTFDSCYLTANVNHDLSGNIMSLLYGDDFIKQDAITHSYAFAFLFAGNFNLISAEKLCLPATRVSAGCYTYMFTYCANLQSTPMIVAKKLKEYSCAAMFVQCKCLTNIQRFEVEELSNGIYGNEAVAACYLMFSQAEAREYIDGQFPSSTWREYSLDISNIILSAPILTACCYSNMFIYCHSIATIPDNFLPATNLSYMCYANMFFGCTSISAIPENLLPAKCLAYACYEAMFANCTSLSNVPDNLLPAITLKPYCYHDMFYNTSIVKAPVLPAKVADYYSYKGMFASCSNLNYIEILAEESLYPENAYAEMLANVSSSGTMICRYDVNSAVAQQKPANWNMYHNKYYNTPLTIKNISTTNSTVTIRPANSTTYLYLKVLSATDYVKVSPTWQTKRSSQYTNIVLEPNEKIEIIANYTVGINYNYTSSDNGTIPFNQSNGHNQVFIGSMHIFATKSSEVYGNITSLNVSNTTNVNSTNWLNYQKSYQDYKFAYLFSGESYGKGNISKADNIYLPPTTTSGSYQYLYFCTFFNTDIEKTPIMPATTIGTGYYLGMYAHSGVKTSETLPATSLKNLCYSRMFENCTSLRIAPVLPATSGISSGSYGSYMYMFRSCTNLEYIKNLYNSNNIGQVGFVANSAANNTTAITTKGIYICNSSLTTTNISKGAYNCPPNFKVYKESAVPTVLSINIDSDYAYINQSSDVKNVSLYEGTTYYNPTENLIKIDNPILTGTTLYANSFGTDITTYKNYRFSNSSTNSNVDRILIDTINPKILHEYTLDDAYLQNFRIYNEDEHLSIENYFGNYINNYTATTVNSGAKLDNISPNIIQPKIISFSCKNY